MRIYTIDSKNKQKVLDNAEAVRLAGSKEKLDFMIEEAQEIYADDPLTCIEFLVADGRIGFEF